MRGKRRESEKIHLGTRCSTKHTTINSI